MPCRGGPQGKGQWNDETQWRLCCGPCGVHLKTTPHLLPQWPRPLGSIHPKREERFAYVEGSRSCPPMPGSPTKQAAHPAAEGHAKCTCNSPIPTGSTSRQNTALTNCGPPDDQSIQNDGEGNQPRYSADFTRAPNCPNPVTNAAPDRAHPTAAQS